MSAPNGQCLARELLAHLEAFEHASRDAFGNTNYMHLKELAQEILAPPTKEAWDGTYVDDETGRAHRSEMACLICGKPWNSGHTIEERKACDEAL